MARMLHIFRRKRLADCILNSTDAASFGGNVFILLSRKSSSLWLSLLTQAPSGIKMKWKAKKSVRKLTCTTKICETSSRNGCWVCENKSLFSTDVLVCLCSGILTNCASFEFDQKCLTLHRHYESQYYFLSVRRWIKNVVHHFQWHVQHVLQNRNKSLTDFTRISIEPTDRLCVVSMWSCENRNKKMSEAELRTHAHDRFHTQKKTK